MCFFFYLRNVDEKHGQTIKNLEKKLKEYAAKNQILGNQLLSMTLIANKTRTISTKQRKQNVSKIQPKNIYENQATQTSFINCDENFTQIENKNEKTLMVLLLFFSIHLP